MSLANGSILRRAGEVLRLEAQTVAAQKRSLDKQFLQAVRLMAACSGRVVVLGVGKSGLITADMVKEDVVIFDFGFSKTNGIICGDVDTAVADKARLLTPVPGGMGPLSVTMLFRNVARIAGVK